MKRQDDGGDDNEQDNGLNRTGGSNASYIPSFGASGTLTNTFAGMLHFENRLNSIICQTQYNL